MQTLVVQNQCRTCVRSMLSHDIYHCTSMSGDPGERHNHVMNLWKRIDRVNDIVLHILRSVLTVDTWNLSHARYTDLNLELDLGFSVESYDICDMSMIICMIQLKDAYHSKFRCVSFEVSSRTASFRESMTRINSCYLKFSSKILRFEFEDRWKFFSWITRLQI